MRHVRQPARINVKALLILAGVFCILMGGAAVGYKVRKRIMADRALAAGKAAVEKQDWVEACKQLKFYLSKYPDDEEILAEYGEANLAVQPRENKYIGQAIAAYRRLLRKRPGDDEICEVLAKLYLRTGEFDEAAYICRQRLEADASDPDAALVLGQALLAQRKNQEATEVLRALATARSDQVQACALLAGLALQTGEATSDRDARRWLDRAVNTNPESARALAQRARYFRRIANNEDAARQDLEAADKLNPDNPSVRLVLAEEWMLWGSLDRAEEELNTVEQVDEELLAEFEIGPEEFKLARLQAGARLCLARLRRSAEEGSKPADRAPLRNAAAELADQALDELLARHRAAFLPQAVELYLAGQRVEDARTAVEQHREVVEKAAVRSSSEAGALMREQLAVLDAAVADAEGKPYAVIDLLSPVVITNPERAQAWRLLWRAFDRTAQRRPARDALEAYVARRPGDTVATLALANAFRGRDWGQVLRYAERAEQAGPDNLEAKMLRIEAKLAGGAGPQTDAGVAALAAELTSLREAHPGAEGIYLLQARIAARSKRLEDVASVLEETISECTDTLRASLQLAALHASNKDWEEALEVSRAARDRLPDLAAPRLALAELQEEAGRVPESRSTLQQAVQELAGEQKVEAAYALAVHMLTHNERPAAIQLLRQLAADRTDDVRTRVNLLAIPEVQDDAQEAQKLVSELKSIEGETGLYWRLEQATLWLRGEDWKLHQEEIKDLLTKCIAADPEWSAPVVALGHLHERLGQSELAESVYRRAVDANPGAIDVVTRLLRLLQAQGRFADAGSILDRMPTDLPALRGHRTDTAIGLGQYDSAIEELQQRIAADPEDAAGRSQLAKVLYRHRRDADAALKLVDEAEASLNKLLDEAESRTDAEERLSSFVLDAVRTRAWILHGEGRGEEVLALLDKEVERRKDSVREFEAIWLRAQYLVATGRLGPAEEDFKHLTTFTDRATEGFALLGRFYMEQDRLDDAIATWDAGLEVDSAHVGLQRLLVGVLVLSPEPERSQRGQDMLDALLERLPNDSELLFAKSATLRNEATPENVQRATELLQRVVQLDPRHVAAYLELVNLTARRGDLQRAGELLSQALGANPQNTDLILAQAKLETQRGNVTAARALVESVLTSAPRNIAARNLQVQLALAAGEMELAETSNDELLAMDPTNEAAQLARARILNSEGAVTEAIASLESYCRTDAGKSAVMPLVILAGLYRGQGDLSTAGDQLDKADRLAPEHIAVFLERLVLLAAQDRFDDLVTAVKARLEKYSDEIPVLAAGGTLLASTGKENYLKEARYLFEQITTLAPHTVDGHLGLAHVAFGLGKLDDAVRAYRRVLAIDPYHRQALNDLAWIRGVEQDAVAEALELAERGVGRYPDDPHFLDTRGVLLTADGRLEEARADLERCLTVVKDLPDTRARALLHLAQVRTRQRDVAQVIQMLEEALAIDRERNVFTSDEHAAIERMMTHVSKADDKGQQQP